MRRIWQKEIADQGKALEPEKDAVMQDDACREKLKKQQEKLKSGEKDAEARKEQLFVAEEEEQ